VLVQQTFRWNVLFLGGIALMWSGAWISGSLFLSASVILTALLGKLWIVPALMLPARLALATFSAELMEWELRLKGYREAGTVVGPDQEAALLRYMDRAGDAGRAVPSPVSGNSIPDPFATAFARRG
jgi:hypothetical protein